jgi:NAD(P)-dependent dehydrogenase (short-subunit alcohol dehydrogenase family)
MEIEGKVVVVTGAASGIGRAMAQRFSEEGAAGVVLADLQGERAQEIAESFGGPALGVHCDVADPAQVDVLVTGTESCFGPVDLFCANAGVAIGTDPMSPDGEWDLAFEVNIRSHVRAARRLLPGWLERGDGYFLSTASAAGLLTQIGSAPYSVTKHAAVAFAEWLSVTYGDRGIRVSCLCPMGVETPLMRQGEGEPGMQGTASATVQATGAVLQPDEVADAVVAALRDERFLVLPHPEVLTFFGRKASDYDRWLAGMRRLQAQVARAG